MENKDLGKCSIGMEPNVAALLSYLLGFISGILIYLVEKDNKFVRFHAMQSIVTFGAISVLYFIFSFIPVLGQPLMIITWITGLILWVVLMFKAYLGEQFELPFAGDIAKKNS